jgi:hypothetical protein
MKAKEKNEIAYLGFFLFTLSVVASPLNGKAAIILLMASFATLIFGGLPTRKDK